jgi:transcriptional regulator with XRE-family HTH domain
MKLRCVLRTIRGERPLREIARAANVNAGELSRIENGSAVPRDEMIPPLEQAYGAMFEDWYPKRTAIALESEDGELDSIRVRMRTSLLPKGAE